MRESLGALKKQERRPMLSRIPSASEYIALLEKWDMKQHAEAYQNVVRIAEAVRKSDGRALLVGGFVRDAALGVLSKDFDVEVYGLEPDRIKDIVQQFGSISEVGKQFGVLKLSASEGIDIDISLPRKDSKVGDGHRGFDVEPDPHMSIEEAARRRDFTMNSMAADPLTGKVYDPFDGAEDIAMRTLRVTDPERFKDDPLRALRAMQFIGRFGLHLDPESAHIIQKEMLADLRSLPKERIFEEWKKLLLKSERPSLGIAAGMSLGIIKELHPELAPLPETPQDPEWHPEGDVWVHTLMALDEAAYVVRREGLGPDDALIVLLTVLVHDIGKPATTERSDGRIRSPKHEAVGVEPTKKLLAEMGVDGTTRKKVAKLVAEHMRPTLLYVEEKKRNNHISDGAIRKLAKRLHPATIRELVLVAEADHVGRGPFADPEMPEQLLLPLKQYPAGPWLLKRARAIAVEESKPADVIRGRDLLALDFKPGPAMGKMISYANQLRDEHNLTREDILALLENSTSNEEGVLALETALASNIESATDSE